MGMAGSRATRSYQKTGAASEGAIPEAIVAKTMAVEVCLMAISGRIVKL